MPSSASASASASQPRNINHLDKPLSLSLSLPLSLSLSSSFTTAQPAGPNDRQCASLATFQNALLQYGSWSTDLKKTDLVFYFSKNRVKLLHLSKTGLQQR